jgi:hypothetical protein
MIGTGTHIVLEYAERREGTSTAITLETRRIDLDGRTP